MSAPTLAHGGHDHGVANSVLKKVFPKAKKFVFKSLKLEGATLKAVETKLGQKLQGKDLTSKAYVAMSGKETLGVAWATPQTLGKEQANVVVGIDKTGKIVGVAIENSPIDALASDNYLRQYAGKKSDAKFKVGKDITAAPKQETASQQLANAVRRAVIVLSQAGI
jgi:hypothetical protein